MLLRAYYELLINLQKRADKYLLSFHPNCDFGNGDLRTRTSNVDRTEMGATVPLVSTFFLTKEVYETSQITPTKRYNLKTCNSHLRTFLLYNLFHTKEPPSMLFI